MINTTKDQIVKEIELASINPKELVKEFINSSIVTSTNNIENQETKIISNLVIKTNEIEYEVNIYKEKNNNLDSSILEDIIGRYVELDSMINKNNITTPHYIIPTIYNNLANYYYLYAIQLDIYSKKSVIEQLYENSLYYSQKGIDVINNYPESIKDNDIYDYILDKLEINKSAALLQLGIIYKKTKETKPIVSLTVQKGPIYLPQNDIVYYEVKADVTGFPKPDLNFISDNINIVYIEENTVKIELKEGQKGKLEALANNTVGSDIVSLEFEWPNKSEIIKQIAIYLYNHFTDGINYQDKRQLQQHINIDDDWLGGFYVYNDKSLENIRELELTLIDEVKNNLLNTNIIVIVQEGWTSSSSDYYNLYFNTKGYLGRISFMQDWTHNKIDIGFEY